MRSVFLLIGLLMSASVIADIGVAGVGGGVALVSVEEPDGKVESTSTVFPSFVYILGVARDQRLISEFSYYNFELDASVSEVGQSVTSLSFSGVYEWRQRVGRHFKPWLGVGLGFGSDSMSSRHRVDADGFLDQAYEDRDAVGLSVILGTSVDIRTQDMNFLLRGTYTIPAYDGLRGAGLSLIYLF